jgi:hypothetical protein
MHPHWSIISKVGFFLLLGGLGACASKSSHPPSNLTPDHFTGTATVTQSADKGAVQINTEKGYEEPYEDISHYRGTYLLASIDRKSGKAAIGVDFMQMTDKPRDKVIVTYEAPEGTMRQTIYVRKGRPKCKGTDCLYLESVSIPLKESLVRHYAQRYTPNLETHWTFRIGDDYTGEIAYAEMAGLIANIDRARKTLTPVSEQAQDALP